MNVMSKLGMAAFAVVACSEVARAEFTQRFAVSYASAASAEKARVCAADLPPGKVFSYSQRWDDANPRHRNMADTLDPLGIKATFYVNGKYDERYPALLTNLVARGHSIADHSVSHDFMQYLRPVAMFRELLECRIRLEVDSQSPVNAFSLPFGGMKMLTDQASRLRFGVALANTGLLGSPQGSDNIAEALGLDCRKWIGTHYFSINDTDPDERLFQKGMAKATNDMVRAGDVYGPHVTMGTHTWQSDEGLKKLSGILSPLAARKDVWFVTESEWIASRIQGFAAKFRTVAVEGAKVTYEVTRPDPADLGAATPLYLKFSEPVVSVRLDKAPGHDVLAKGLPAVGDVPRRYRRLSQEAITAEGDALRFAFANDSDDDWTSASVTLRLPWASGVMTRRLAGIRKGERRVVTFEKVQAPADALFEGEMYAAVQVDAHGSRGVERLWATWSRPGSPALANVPRDTCAAAGPFAEAECPTAELLAALSVPGAALADLAGGKAKWRGVERSERYHPNVAHLAPKRPIRIPGRRMLAFAYDFDADTDAHGKQWDLALKVQSLGKGRLEAYVNGTKVADVLTLRKGSNRLVVVHDMPRDYCFIHEIAIRSKADRSSVSFVPVALGK